MTNPKAGLAIRASFLIALYLLSSRHNADAATNRLSAAQQKKLEAREKAIKMAKMKASGQDVVGMTKEAAELRSYELRKKKKKGILKRKEASLAQVLFPGASPEEYVAGERIPAFVELVESKKTQLPFEY